MRATQPAASLGLMYARGYGVEKNMPLAMKWRNLAAIQRDPGAQDSLSTLYFIGDGVPQNFPESARLRKEAASRGHVQAQSGLGRMYSEGKGVDNDLRQTTTGLPSPRNRRRYGPGRSQADLSEHDRRANQGSRYPSQGMDGEGEKDLDIAPIRHSGA